VILWTLDPAERDAVLAKEWHPKGRALVEIACACTPAQLFAARQAYHDRFKRSLEEDVAAHVTEDFRKVTLLLIPSLIISRRSYVSVFACHRESCTSLSECDLDLFFPIVAKLYVHISVCCARFVTFVM
jgi:hypothetical protein